MVRIKTITWFVATLLLTLAVSPGIVGCSRQYDARLTRIAEILTHNKMTRLELHTALLTKCGFKPSDMNILLGRSNGAIISRKKTLGAKVLGRKESVTVISAIIRRL